MSKLRITPVIQEAIDRQRPKLATDVLAARLRECELVDAPDKPGCHPTWKDERFRDSYLAAIIDGRILIGS